MMLPHLLAVFPQQFIGVVTSTLNFFFKFQIKLSNMISIKIITKINAGFVLKLITERANFFNVSKSSKVFLE